MTVGNPTETHKILTLVGNPIKKHKILTLVGNPIELIRLEINTEQYTRLKIKLKEQDLKL